MPSHRKTKRKKKGPTTTSSGDDTATRTTKFSTRSTKEQCDDRRTTRQRTRKQRKRTDRRKDLTRNQDFRTRSDIRWRIYKRDPDHELNRSVYESKKELCAKIMKRLEQKPGPEEQNEPDLGFLAFRRELEGGEYLTTQEKSMLETRDRQRSAQRFREVRRQIKTDLVEKITKRKKAILSFQHTKDSLRTHIKTKKYIWEMKRKRKSITTSLIQSKLKTRDYVKLLPKAVLSTLKSNTRVVGERLTDNKLQEWTTPSTGYAREHNGRILGTDPGMQAKANGRFNLTERAPWMVPPWTRLATPTCGRHTLTEMAPWMVPPWKSVKGRTLDNQFPATQTEGLRGIQGRLLRMAPWMVPPWINNN